MESFRVFKHVFWHEKFLYYAIDYVKKDNSFSVLLLLKLQMFKILYLVHLTNYHLSHEEELFIKRLKIAVISKLNYKFGKKRNDCILYLCRC